MVKNKLNRSEILFEIDNLNYEIEVLKNFLAELESVFVSKIEKLIENKKMKNQKFLFPHELKAVGKEEYFNGLKKEKINKYLKKYNFRIRYLNQRKSRNEITDNEYYQKTKELEIQKEDFINRIEKYYEELSSKNSKDDTYLNTYLSLKDVKEKELDEYKNYLVNKYNKKLKHYQERIEKRIKLLSQKVKKLENSLSEIDASKKTLSPGVLLKLDQVSMQFGGLKAVDNLSFEVYEKEIFGLIGPNGAGKTTVFNCITQFYKPTSGNIYFLDKYNSEINLNKIKVHNVIKHGIVRTFQNVELIWELSVLDNLLVAAHSLYRSSLFDQIFHTRKYKIEELSLKHKAMQVLESLNLLVYKDIVPFGLPYGILKRIELARTLMVDPKLIILDEPAAGLNEVETKELAETIKKIQKQYDCTIFLVEHDMSLVMDICDRVCAINFGKKLALGTPKEIQANKAVQEAYLGGE